MAYQLIATHNVYDFEQEEIVEKNLVVDDDGKVTEQVKVIQEHAHTWAELKIYQSILASENKSSFKAELWAYAHAGGEYGDGFIYSAERTEKDVEYEGGYVGDESTWYSDSMNRIIFNDLIYTKTSRDVQPTEKNIRVYTGSTVSQLLAVFETDDSDLRDAIGMTSSRYQNLVGYHNLDGSFTALTCNRYREDNHNKNDYRKFPLSFYGHVSYCLKDIIIDEKPMIKNCFNDYEDLGAEVVPISRGLTPTTAENFTDEESPLIVYTIPTGRSFTSFTQIKYVPPMSEVVIPDAGYVNREDAVTSLQVALSFDGETIDIPYRDMPIGSTNYVFTLTEAEREILRTKAQGSTNVPIYYMFKTERHIPYSEFKAPNGKDKNYVDAQTVELISKTQRILTIVGAYPSINPTVRDVNSDTLALTGDENTFIRYESMAEYAINATASKNATIVTQSVTCGSKTVTDLPYGVIDDVEDATFNFYALDSRNMAVSGTVFKNLIEYVKPTCYQKLEIELSGEVTASIKLTVSGNYYNGSFGAVDNTLLLEVRHTDDDGNMGEWTTLTGTPTFRENLYELETVFSGFNYGNSYVFQCRATDKLNVVQSSQYTIKFLPVFDWSDKDFNFNVPVNIEADNLDMHGQTIIRHNETANNTVLSASGGHIYIRPGGTNSTSGETIFYPNGDIKFGGTVDLGDSFTLDGNELADFVIESGSEAMGSNGTWHWAKWASGKAECWGCRNFGTMAVTKEWGNLYRSEFLTQNLPDDLFVTTPDVININIVNATFGGWICKHENLAPSAVTTGSFIFVRPASATVTAPTYIGFHVIGLWKQ